MCIVVPCYLQGCTARTFLVSAESAILYGSITIEKSAGLVDFGPSGKVAGDMTLGNNKLKIESIHNMEGSFIPVDHPLGYYLSVGGETVAAIQVNGRITLQSDGADMDAYAIETVASSLSIRPEED